MKIGEITIKNNLILAPMAGYTVPAMRRLSAENGAGLTITEMVSVKGLLFGNEKTEDLLKTHPAESVTCVQLFGSDPQDFYRCVRLPVLQKFDIVDINMGCPVKKIVQNGEGSALINTPALAAELVAAVKEGLALLNTKNESGIKHPRAVTVKTRFSQNVDGRVNPDKTLDFLHRLQAAGADMIGLHARTPAQMYSGSADYLMFEAIKSGINLPMALSGDIVDYSSYRSAAASGADFLMIGRGAIANPAIFTDILMADGMTNGDFTVDNPHKDSSSGADFCNNDFFGAKNFGVENQALNRQKHKVALILTLMEYMRADFGEEWAVKTLRKFWAYLLKGEGVRKEQRHKINFIDDYNALKAFINPIFAKN